MASVSWDLRLSLLVGVRARPDGDPVLKLSFTALVALGKKGMILKARGKGLYKRSSIRRELCFLGDCARVDTPESV